MTSRSIPAQHIPAISGYFSIDAFIRTLIESDVQSPVVFDTYESLESEYLADRVHPGDLKAAVTDAMNRLLVGDGRNPISTE